MVINKPADWVPPTMGAMKRCKFCSRELIGGRKDRKFCDARCAAEYQKKAWRESNPKSATATLQNNTIAEVNEMRVAIDLLRRGFAVYRAAFQGMPCDMVVSPEGNTIFGKVLRVEVTTGNRTPKGTIVHPDRDASKYDVLAVVIGDEIFYKPEL